MATIKAVRTDAELECPLLDAGLRARNLELVLVPDGITEAQLVREVQDAAILLMCYTPVTARVIESATRLRGIVKYGVGIDAIDIDAARSRGVPVVNIPEYAERTVAEGAFTLLLALAKKLASMHAAMRRDGWVWPGAPWLATDIAGKTVGLVGVGRIGRSMAQMAGAGFQARVLGFDPNMSASQMRAAGVEKRGAILINVSRGAIVDEGALLYALREGRLGGAGLDVFATEPLNKTVHPLAPLFEMDNVILTPHLTLFTREAMQRLEEEALQRCDELLSGQPVLVKSRDPRLTAQEKGVRFPTT